MEGIFDIRAKDIKDWASGFETPGKIPILLRRLIYTTCESVISIDFPADESVTHGGWDGELKTKRAFLDYIPEGISFWELSKSKNIMKKARKDIKKRSDSILSDPKKNISDFSFVFVTPQKWTHKTSKSEWAEKQKVDFGWKSVKVIDSEDLAQWIEHSIPTQLYFAELTGKTNFLQGVTLSTRFWKDWKADCKPCFPVRLFDDFLIKNKGILLEFFSNKNTNLLQISCNSFEEGLAFLHCALSENKDIFNRMIAIKKTGILPNYIELDNQFIPIFAGDDVMGEYGKSGGKVPAIQIIGPNIRSSNVFSIDLRRLSLESFSELLKGENIFTLNEIETLYWKSGGELTVLRRLLSEYNSLSPNWYSDTEIAKKLIPFMLAGTWNTETENDELVLCALAKGKNQTELENDFNDLIQLEDSPVWGQGEFRGVVSKIDSFLGIYNSITKKDLEIFFNIARKKIVKINKKVEIHTPNLLVVEKNNSSNGKLVPTETKEIHETEVSLNFDYDKLSDKFIEGIVDTILFLSFLEKESLDRNLNFEINLKCEINKTIKELIGNLDENIIDLYHKFFVTFAEVSPDTFLKIIEDKFLTNTLLIEYLIENNFGNSLLRALEILAWSSKYFNRVTTILTELAIFESDRDKNVSLESLFSLFRWKCPQTYTGMEQKMSVLDDLVDEHQEVAWGIIKLQFDEGSNTCSNVTPTVNVYLSEIDEQTDPSTKIHDNFLNRCYEIGINWKNHTKETLLDLCQLLGNERCIALHDDICSSLITWAKSASVDEKRWIEDKIRSIDCIESQFEKKAIQALNEQNS